MAQDRQPCGLGHPAEQARCRRQRHRLVQGLNIVFNIGLNIDYTLYHRHLAMLSADLRVDDRCLTGLWKESPMGLYDDHVLPRVINIACGARTADPLRKRVCEGLHGEVVELGFGSGLNVPFYPPAVKRVHAIEPSDVGWRLADRRVSASQIPVERSGPDGQALPFDDDTFDSAVSTWTLCTIPGAGAALREVRRILKPGGTLHFVEHGLAPDEAVRRWQRRLEPVQKRLAGGCHLTRRAVPMIADAGFTVTDVEHFYQEGAPKVLGAASLGVAAAPD